MKNVIEKACYLPYNLKLSELVEKHPPAFDFHIGEFRYLLNLMTAIAANFPDLITKGGFVPMSATRMKKFVNNYNEHLFYLRKHGVIERDGMYTKGEKCFGYRYTKKYQTPVIKQFLGYSPIEIQLRKLKDENVKSCEQYPYLTKWFNEHLKLDLEGGSILLNERLEREATISPEHAIAKYNAGFMQISEFEESKRSYLVDATGRRFHSSITRMPKLLRNLLTYNGQHMVCIDINNAAPFFSLLLFKENFYGEWDVENESEKVAPEFRLENVYPEMYQAVCSTIAKKEAALKEGQFMYSLFCALPTATSTVYAEAKGAADNYKEHVVNGTLYDYFAEIVKDTTGIEFASRKKLKEEYNKVVFSKNSFYNHPAAIYKRAFNSHFEFVSQVFTILKSENNAHLPILLQRIEAYAMLNVIAKRISEERPDMPIYTIHDGLVVPEAAYDYACNVMLEELTKIVGVEPKLTGDLWC